MPIRECLSNSELREYKNVPSVHNCAFEKFVYPNAEGSSSIKGIKNDHSRRVVVCHLLEI
jgi:hypothetical protein